MTKKNCPAGSKWDHVVNNCILHLVDPRRESPTVLAPFFHQRTISPDAQADAPIGLSPVLWIVVGLTTLGSIVALALWFVIYRWQRRLRRTSEVEPGPEPPQKIKPSTEGHFSATQRGRGIPDEMLHRASACGHLSHQGPHDTSKWEGGSAICGAPWECQKATGGRETDGAEDPGDLSVCNAMTEHRLPLPATELGGTTLVTAKTV
ncbi:uncharacterized protein LOC133514365 isoform X2 [Syngnathoides biaculeatus]|uniref:uncharacterized protein LOC133514365 isoform X2 n=1 Tax=Syngnathoides biaculeatus TaxID=300417 RepID=UPI002ADDF6FE|nr:uncharacterized protein LOC133514365 isoform X2 [Syngnathoides biaculeatus]